MLGKLTPSSFSKGLLWGRKAGVRTGSLMGPGDQPLLGTLVQRPSFRRSRVAHRGIPGAMILAMTVLCS